MKNSKKGKQKKKSKKKSNNSFKQRKCLMMILKTKRNQRKKKNLQNKKYSLCLQQFPQVFHRFHYNQFSMILDSLFVLVQLIWHLDPMLHCKFEWIAYKESEK